MRAPRAAATVGGDRGGSMTATQTFTVEQARHIGETIGIVWDDAPFDIEEFRVGLGVELEHGAHDAETDVIGDDEVLTGKIAWVHLKELPDYYTRLVAMEAKAEAEAGARWSI
jgi:hypothetical protein